MEITHITTGAEKAGLSRSLIQKAQSTNNQTVGKPANTASPSLDVVPGGPHYLPGLGVGG